MFAPRPTSSSGPTGELRLLIVEDDAVDRTLARRTLRSVGLERGVTEALTVAEARELLASQAFDCVLLDFQLPDGTGLSLLDHLQELPDSPAVVMLTGYTDQRAAMRALALGAQDWLIKEHIDAQSLWRAICYALERKRAGALQRRLIEAERLAVVGNLVGAVSHEVNNPLAALCTNLDLLQAQLALAEDAEDPAARRRALATVTELARDARRGSDRIAQVMRGLSRYPRRTPPEDEQAVDLVAAAEAALALVRHQLRHRASLQLRLQPVPAIRGRSSELEQVVLHLLLNANQALPEATASEHRVVLRTRVVHGDPVLEVSDTGCGLDPAELPDLVQAGVSRWADGPGAGLGLWFCHDVAKRLGGRLEVEGRPGRGSRFRLRFPAWPDPPAGPAPAPAVAADPTRDTPRLRVLVVDDDELVLRSFTRILARAHDLSTARSGVEAHALLAGGARFDAILCDVMMPDMDGPTLYAHVQRSTPDQARRMGFVTGGAFTSGARRLLEWSDAPVLQKPVHPGDLLAFAEELAARGRVDVGSQAASRPPRPAR